MERAATDPYRKFAHHASHTQARVTDLSLFLEKRKIHPAYTVGVGTKRAAEKRPLFYWLYAGLIFHDQGVAVSGRLWQLLKRLFGHQSMHFSRRVQRIPEKILIAVLAECAFGDAKSHARIRDVREVERFRRGTHAA